MWFQFSIMHPSSYLPTYFWFCHSCPLTILSAQCHTDSQHTCTSGAIAVWEALQNLRLWCVAFSCYQAAWQWYYSSVWSQTYCTDLWLLLKWLYLKWKKKRCWAICWLYLVVCLEWWQTQWVGEGNKSFAWGWSSSMLDYLVVDDVCDLQWFWPGCLLFLTGASYQQNEISARCRRCVCIVWLCLLWYFGL